MELKEVFDKRFPANLRIRYRNSETSEEINAGLAKIWEVNQIDENKLTNQYLVKKSKQAKYIGY